MEKVFTKTKRDSLLDTAISRVAGSNDAYNSEAMYYIWCRARMNPDTSGFPDIMKWWYLVTEHVLLKYKEDANDMISLGITIMDIIRGHATEDSNETSTVALAMHHTVIRRLGKILYPEVTVQ